MLSTIGRAAVRRVGGGASQSTNRALCCSLLRLHGVDASQNSINPSAQRQFTIALRRAYATATKDVAKPKAKSAVKAKAKPKSAAKKPAKKPVKKKVKKTKAKAKPKPKIKKAVKKPLTDEQKLRLDIKKLKETALLAGQPKSAPISAWQVVLKEGGDKISSKISERAKSAAEVYKALSPSELEVSTPHAVG